MRSKAAYCLLSAGLAAGNVYDYFMPDYISGCSTGCADWASAGTYMKNYTQAQIDAMFINGTASAGAQCAMPGATAGNHECDCGEKNAYTYMTDSYAGPWCFCKDGGMAYCSPPNSTVEQLNLQLAASDVVVAAFITYEPLPKSPAVAMIGTSEDAMTQVEGVSHIYTPPGRTYIMHYVTFSGLKPRQQYYYKVKSGSSACQWTDVFSFRAPYSSGVTKIATYGDMGHSHYNNMGNMKDDCEAGTIDAVVHMGDHAYNMGMTNDARGDAYMNVLQPLLRGCPWMPIIGNHEGSDGDHYKRYEQMALGEMIGEGTGVRSTATTALGRHLSLGSLYGAGSHATVGTVASNTSRYTSSNIGLIHMAGIDLMNFDDTQVAWLTADLEAANANRANVPWIMVMAHYQVYHVSVSENLDMSAEAFLGDAGENWRALHNQSLRWRPCDTPGCQTIGEWRAGISSKLEPLLLKYGVDIYNAGHIHDYESTWPMKNNTLCKQSFDNPTCPVYVVEGNGGVPGCSGNCKVNECKSNGGKDGWCRLHGSACGAYGRITITDANTLRYDHVANNGSQVIDTWTITQKNHGPFPL